MTCILGLVADDFIILAGDKMGSNGRTKDIFPRPKVFKNGEFLIGYTSSFNMGQILEFQWVPPVHTIHMDDDEYIYKEVRQSIKTTLDKHDFGTTKGKESLEPELGTFLFVYHNKLYEYQQNSSILEIDFIGACGCGTDHMKAAARAYLYAYDDLVPEGTDICIEKFLSSVYQTVAHLDCFVSASHDFFIVNKRTKQIYFRTQEFEE